MPSKKLLSVSSTAAPVGGGAPSSPPSISLPPASPASGKKQGAGLSPETMGGGVDPPDRSDTQGSGDFSSKPAKHAWNKQLIGAGKDFVSEPVMGAVSWPALADARDRKTLDIAKSILTPPATEVPPIQGSGAGAGRSRWTEKGAGGSGSVNNTAIDSRQRMMPTRGTSNMMP
eukprot:c6588_g2_i1 orf=1-516(-)